MIIIIIIRTICFHSNNSLTMYCYALNANIRSKSCNYDLLKVCLWLLEILKEVYNNALDKTLILFTLPYECLYDRSIWSENFDIYYNIPVYSRMVLLNHPRWYSICELVKIVGYICIYYLIRALITFTSSQTRFLQF